MFALLRFVTLRSVGLRLRFSRTPKTLRLLLPLSWFPPSFLLYSLVVSILVLSFLRSARSPARSAPSVVLPSFYLHSVSSIGVFRVGGIIHLKEKVAKKKDSYSHLRETSREKIYCSYKLYEFLLLFLGAT